MLSPQRRSFLTGCQGTAAGNGPQAASGAVPNNKKEEISLRPETSRRVGSGRILTREREQLRDREHVTEEPGFDRDRER